MGPRSGPKNSTKLTHDIIQHIESGPGQDNKRPRHENEKGVSAACDTRTNTTGQKESSGNLERHRGTPEQANANSTSIEADRGSSGSNETVGRSSRSIHSRILRSNTDGSESSLEDHRKQKIHGPSTAKRGRTKCQKSSCHDTDPHEKVPEHSTVEIKVDGSADVDINVPTRGSDKNTSDEANQTGCDLHPVELMEVRSLRKTGGDEICDGTKTVGGLDWNESIVVRRATERIKEGGTVPNTTLDPKRSGDSFGESGIFHGADWENDRTHTDVGSKPGRTPLHRPVFISTRSTGATEDVDGARQPYLLSEPIQTESYLSWPEASDENGPEMETVWDPYDYWNREERLMTYLEGEKVSHRPRRKPCKEPLAPITSNRIDLKALRSLKIPPSPRLEEVLKWIEGDILRDTILKSERERNTHNVSRHLLGELDGLCAQKIFKWSPPTDYTVNVPLFKVPKGDQARLIGDCREINGLLPRPGPMGLKSIHTIISRLLAKNFLYQRDGKSYFYQFGLSESAGRAFGIRVGDKRGSFRTGHWNVMPMGFTYAPVIAQETSNCVCENVELPDTVIDPWVDNFLMGAEDLGAMDTLIEKFLRVTESIQLELKPEDHGVSRVMDALGLTFHVESNDKREHYVELSEKHRMELEQTIPHHNPTPREVFQWFGRAMWGIYAVLREPLSKWPKVYRILQELGKILVKDRFLWDSPRLLDEATVEEFRHMIKVVASARLYFPELENFEPDEVIWTDASMESMGILVEGNDARTETSSEKGHHIFLRELFVATHALVKSAVKGNKPLLMVDNAAAVRALQRGHSGHAAANEILKEAYALLPSGFQAKIAWTPTMCQRADPLTRGYNYPGPRCNHNHEKGANELRWGKKERGRRN